MVPGWPRRPGRPATPRAPRRPGPRSPRRGRSRRAAPRSEPERGPPRDTTSHRAGPRPGRRADRPAVQPRPPDPVARAAIRTCRSRPAAAAATTDPAGDGDGGRPSVRPGLGAWVAAVRLRGARLGCLEVLDLGVHLGDVEIDLGRRVGRPRQGVSRGELLGDLLGEPSIPATAPAQRRRRRLRHRCRPSAAGPVATRSWSFAPRPARAVHRHRRARPGGRHRPVEVRTC